MAASGAQQTPRRRIALAIVAVGLALAIALASVSVVLFGGDDESRADRPTDAPGLTVPDESTTDQPDDVGPPAKVELRPVLKLLPASADCSAADVWCTRDRAEAYRLGPAELRTPDIVEAEARLSDYGQWVVGVLLSDHGATRFEAVTRDLADNTGATAQLAIVVDDVVITAPAVQAPVPGGQIDISANFTQAEAEELAAAIQP
jgi:preprotein translocase subunit SecD